MLMLLRKQIIFHIFDEKNIFSLSTVFSSPTGNVFSFWWKTNVMKTGSTGSPLIEPALKRFYAMLEPLSPTRSIHAAVSGSFLFIFGLLKGIQ